MLVPAPCCASASPHGGHKGMMGQQIPLTRVDLNSDMSRNEIKRGQSALCFLSAFPLMTGANPPFALF